MSALTFSVERGRALVWSGLRSSFVRDIAGSFANRLLLLAIGIVASVLITRALGPAGRGQYALALAIAAVGVQLGNLGLHASNTYAVSRRPDLMGTLVANSLLVSVAVGCGGGLIAWLAFAILPALAPVPSTLLALALLSVPLGLAYLLLQNLLLGTQQVRFYNLVELGLRVSSTVTVIGLIVLVGITPSSVFVISIATTAVGVVLLLRHLGGSASMPVRPSLGILGEHSRYGFKAYLAALLSFLVLRSDLFLVSSIRGDAAAGYYSIAVALADLVYMLPTTVGMLLFPRLSAMTEASRMWWIARQLALIIGIIMTGLGVLGAALRGPQQSRSSSVTSSCLPNLHSSCCCRASSCFRPARSSWPTVRRSACRRSPGSRH